MSKVAAAAEVATVAITYWDPNFGPWIMGERGDSRSAQMPVSELTEYIHFCHKDAVDRILASGWLMAAEEREAAGIATVGGFSGRCGSVFAYSVAISSRWPVWGCLPLAVIRHPEDYMALWFTADPALFLSLSSDQVTAHGSLPLNDCLVVSVAEGFALMKSSIADALDQNALQMERYPE